MDFLVVGAGAMGCLFSARLKMAGFPVSLLEIVEESAAQITQHGIRVEGVTGDYRVEVPVFLRSFPPPPDLALICVKSYDTRSAGNAAAACQRPNSVVLTLQNGIGNMEILSETFGEERVLGGITSEGATGLGPGRIRHAGQGETIIGSKNGKEVLVHEIVSAFKRAGFNCSSSENVNDLIWGKLIVNVGINALTAITRLKNGRLPELKATRLIMAEAVTEAVSVAKAKNIELPYSDALAKVVEVCRGTSENMSSMLQDVLKGRMTEIDAINGAIVREGQTLGIPTPVNFTLTSLVHSLEETYLERIRANRLDGSARLGQLAE